MWFLIIFIICVYCKNTQSRSLYFVFGQRALFLLSIFFSEKGFSHPSKHEKLIMYMLIIGVYLYSSNSNAKPLGISKLVKHCHEKHDNDRRQSLAEVEHRQKNNNVLSK